MDAAKRLTLIVVAALLWAGHALAQEAPRPVQIVAYINVSNGCQEPTVQLLRTLPQRYPGVQVELIDFGDGGQGLRRWQDSGYHCMTIEINRSPYARFPVGDRQRLVAFQMPVGGQWTHEDLIAAVEAARAGTLRRATQREVDAELQNAVTVVPVTVDGKQVARLTVRGAHAFSIAASAAGNTPAQRAQIIANSIRAWLFAGGKASDLRIAQSGGDWLLMAGSQKLGTVTSADAQVAGKSTQALANDWLAGLTAAVRTQ